MPFISHFPGPPRLDKSIGRSWWRTKTRRIQQQPKGAELRRQRSIISAVTLAAISMQNSTPEQQPEQQEDGMELRQRHGGKLNGSGGSGSGGRGGGSQWMMMETQETTADMEEEKHNKNDEEAVEWGRSVF
jgi:hypothetical protein